MEASTPGAPSLAERDAPLGRWVKALLARAHKNTVVVALANKLARIAWAVLAHGRGFEADHAAGEEAFDGSWKAPSCHPVRSFLNTIHMDGERMAHGRQGAGASAEGR